MTYDDQHRVTIAPGSYPGLTEAIEAAGHYWENNGGEWYADDAQAVQAIIAGYVVPDPLPPAQAAKWEDIKAERDRRQVLGVRVGAHRFHSDEKSRIQQLGLVMMGASIPSGLQWKTLDGDFVTMTPTLAQQIFGATAASDQAIFAAAEVHHTTMMQSDAPQDYDYSTGWPEV